MLLVVAGVACLPGRAARPPVDPPPDHTVLAEEAGASQPSLSGSEPPLAPLTGLPAQAGSETRDAVVVKIDNQFGAGPPAGVNQADLVFELLVEGVTRFGAVYRSNQPQLVGPVRSARTSDPALFEMLNRPVVAFSGANDGTLSQLESSQLRPVHPGTSTIPWREDPSRDAPHDLFVSVEALAQGATPGSGPPAPLFRYRSAALRAPPCEDVGLAIEFFEDDEVSFVWECSGARWLRYRNGRASVGADGEPIWATNVVVLDTVYQSSSADGRSPEAVTLGTGAAIALVDGAVLDGSWMRGVTTEPPVLRRAGGAPMELEPGRTWVALPPPRRAHPLEAAEVRELLTS